MHMVTRMAATQAPATEVAAKLDYYSRLREEL
jgi:hypothetical protein